MLPTTYVEGFHDRESVSNMRYTYFGGTGLFVSKLSLGGGAFSNFYDEFDEHEAIETIREAIRRGVNFIDTAPWYGQGRSENIIGKALRGIPRSAYYIATKVGRYEPHYEKMFNFTAEKTEESFFDSLRKLGLDYVDIIQVHDIEFAPSLEFVLHETLPVLQKLKDNGRARFIGVTGYPLSVLCEAIEKSKVHIDTVLTYCRSTLIDNTLDDYLNFLDQKEIGIINAAPHSMGLLTNAGPPKWHPASEQTKHICKKAAKFCKEKNIELGRLAAWDCFVCSKAATNLIGMNNRNLLNSNLSVMKEGLKDNEKEVFKIVNEKYFIPIKRKTNWEGVELRRYRDYMNGLQ